MHYTGFIALLGTLLVLADALYSALKGRTLKLGLVGYLILLVDWILYMWAFAIQDYTLKPVYETSSQGLPLVFKIASSWSSGGGSLFLFTIVLTSVALIHRKHHDDSRLSLGYNALIVASASLAFLNGAFDSFNGQVVTGMGLNPLLKSPWIYPHPLSTFAAYALIVASAVSLFTGYERASDILARMGWLLLTLGIAIGGYWSYMTFGWGGYWAWDPVETAELTPWLALTALFHIRALDKRLSYTTHMAVAGSVFLAILVTRVGISPLHSFASPRSVTSMVTIALMALFIFEGLRRARGAGESLKNLTSSPYRLGLMLSYFSLIMMFVILLVVLGGASIGRIIGLDVNVPQMDSGIKFFHPVLFPFTLMLIASLPMCTIGSRLSWREIGALLVGLSIVAAILVYLTYTRDVTWSPASSLVTNLMISALLPFASAGIFSGLASAYIYARDRLDVMASVSVLHAALAITMLGILLSGPFAYNRSYFKETSLSLGQEVEIEGIRMKLLDYKYELYGGDVDLYTPYVGKSDTYKRASLTLLLLAMQFGDAIRQVNQGRERLKSMGILQAYELMKDGYRVEGSYSSRADAAVVNVSNASLKLGEISDLRVELREPVAAGFLTAKENETVFRVLLVGNITLRGVGELQPTPFTMINLTFPEPLEVPLADSLLEVKRASLVFFDMLRQGHSFPKKVDDALVSPNSTLIVEEGRFLGTREFEVPTYLKGRDVMLYVAFKEGKISSGIMEILERHGLTHLLTNETFVSKLLSELLPGSCKELIHRQDREALECLGYLPIPKELPEGAKLTLTIGVDAGNGEVNKTLEIRFDANGEVQGIHGLVAHVLPIDNGLSEVYLVFNPPVVREKSWSIGYHELMVYYLSQAFKGLSEDQRLALASLFATAYLSQSVEDQQMMLPYTLDLYDLASKFDPSISTLRGNGAFVQVKVIPYVALLWWGIILMSLAELYVLIAAIRGRRT